MDLPETALLADLIALRPASYFIRIAIATAAFFAACNGEKVIARVIGLVILLITGGGLLLVGLGNSTAVDILLGLVGLSAAGYSWWTTRA